MLHLEGLYPRRSRMGWTNPALNTFYHQRSNSPAVTAINRPQRPPSRSTALPSPLVPAQLGGPDSVGLPVVLPTPPLVKWQPGAAASSSPRTRTLTRYELSEGPRRQRRRLNGASLEEETNLGNNRRLHGPYELPGHGTDLICSGSQQVRQHFQCTAALPNLSQYGAGERGKGTPLSKPALTPRPRGPGLHDPDAAAAMMVTAAAGSSAVAYGGGDVDADRSGCTVECPAKIGGNAGGGAIESKSGFGALSDPKASELRHPGDWCDTAAALAEVRLRQQLDYQRYYQQNQATAPINPINPMPYRGGNTIGRSIMNFGRGYSQSGAPASTAPSQPPPPPPPPGSPDGAWLQAFMKGTASRAAAVMTPSLEQLARALWALQVLYPGGEWQGDGGGPPAASARPGVDVDGSQDSSEAPAAAAPTHLGPEVRQQQRQGEAWLRWWWRATSLAVAQLEVTQPAPDMTPLVLLLEVLQPLVSEVATAAAPPPLRPPGFWRGIVAAAVERQVLAAAASAAGGRGGEEAFRGDRAAARVSGNGSAAAAQPPPVLESPAAGDKGDNGVLRNLIALLRGYTALGLHEGRAVRCLAPALLQYAVRAPYGSGPGAGAGRLLLATLPDEDLAALMRWHQLYGSPLQDATFFVQVLLERSGASPHSPRVLPLPLLLDMLAGVSTSARPLPPPLAGRLAAWVARQLDHHLNTPNSISLSSSSNSSSSSSSSSGSSSGSGSSIHIDGPDGNSSASGCVGGNAAGLIRASPTPSLPTDPRVSTTAMATGSVWAVAGEGQQTGKPQQLQTLHVVLELFVCVARLAARHARRSDGAAAAAAMAATATVATAAVSTGIELLPALAGQDEEAAEESRLGEAAAAAEEEEEEVAAATEAGAGVVGSSGGDDNPFPAVLDAFLPYLRARFFACSASELQKAVRQVAVARRLFPGAPGPASAKSGAAAAAAATTTSATTAATAASPCPTSAAWSALEAAWEPLLESSGCGRASPGPLRQLVVDVSFISPDWLSRGFMSQLLHAVTTEVDRTAFLLTRGTREHGEGRLRRPQNARRHQRQASPAARTAVAPPPPPPPSPPPSRPLETALSPDEISYVAAAVARLTSGHRFGLVRIVRRLAAGVLAAAPRMSPTALTQAIWALAELGAKAPHVIGPTGAELLLNVLGARLAAVPPKSLPLLLWSLARIRLRPASRWMVSYTRIVQTHVRQYDMRQVAQLAWAYGQLMPAAPYSKLFYRPPRGLVRCLLRRSFDAMRIGEPRSSTKVLQPQQQQQQQQQPSGKGDAVPRRVVENRVTDRLSQPTTRGPEATVASPPSQPLRRGGLGVSYHYSRLRPGDAALLVFGLVGMEARPGSVWMRRLYGWSGPKLSSFTPRDLGMLLFALGALGAQPPYHWVCRAARYMSVKLPYASGLDVAHAAAGLARLAPCQLPWSAVAAFKAVVPRLLRRRTSTAGEAADGDADSANDISAGNAAGDGAASVSSRRRRGSGGSSVQGHADRRGSEREEGRREAWADFLRSAFSQLADNARPPVRRGPIAAAATAPVRSGAADSSGQTWLSVRQHNATAMGYAADADDDADADADADDDDDGGAKPAPAHSDLIVTKAGSSSKARVKFVLAAARGSRRPRLRWRWRRLQPVSLPP
ncbi:hypothetical protein Vretimale_10386 [Volvox reticuliferus]|uniref:Uncharacterized protein n=1 Tax=Volvox reticuliferus TaxID=1737510 RepID=A0A8J4CRB3_9CHLO|nr:hypothetical protein Vretifemale_12372 [Volvox reticuliferus]GIM05979.1 hypothetical protein Vretimale_10386 [Volvox reticuliferus]